MNHPLLNMMADKGRWLKARNDYMECARATRLALTDPNSYWRLSPSDERVKFAVGVWVRKAKRAHKIAMGITPVCHHIDLSNQAQGAIYAA
jgi:hypothetical protein